MSGNTGYYVDAIQYQQAFNRPNDETALDRFEQLVLTQKPAEKPWEPVTPYDLESRKAIEGKHPELIRDVFQADRILDAGMGPGHLVHLLRVLLDPPKLSSFGRWVYGFDISRGGLCYGDLAREDLGGFTQPPGLIAELVICREVLEHLTIRQIRTAVTNLCKLSNRFVYVTTRFAKDPQHLLDVDTADDLDPTHITMMNQSLLRVLFVLEGFKRRADLEAKMDWQGKKRVLVYERAA